MRLVWQRRTAAEKVLNATGHAGIGEASLWTVLSTPPVLNAGEESSPARAHASLARAALCMT
jgi:hypothetical protein